jgi:6-phosphogluconate dehydrogenase
MTPGRSTGNCTADEGYLHCGPAGAGTLREGGSQRDRIRPHGSVCGGPEYPRPRQRRRAQQAVNAETAPLPHPEHYQYDFVLADVAEVWRRGSVIGSWLLDLTAEALAKEPDLQQFSGHVSDSGEGRWAAHAAIESATAAPVLIAALFQRFSSRGEDYFSDRLQSAMRFQFGRHVEHAVEPAILRPGRKDG